MEGDVRKCVKDFIRHERTMPEKFYDYAPEERRGSVLRLP